MRKGVLAGTDERETFGRAQHSTSAARRQVRFYVKAGIYSIDNSLPHRAMALGLRLGRGDAACGESRALPS